MEQLLQSQQQYFHTGRTRDVQQRRQALQTLIEGIHRYELEIAEALHRDLGKSHTEAYATEIGIVLHEARQALKHVGKWAKARRVRTPLTHIGSKGYIIPEPYGSVLIIVPWNYPFQLAISPLIGAIAAGNTAVIKPSELAPHTSALLTRLIQDLFPPSFVSVVEGGIETNEALLELPFNYIFFTGSTAVGRIVMQAAAKRLIPVTLELGGKSPCIVHHDADIDLAAKRIAFGKWTNAGQTCVAPDYVYVHRSQHDALISRLQAVVKQFYGDEPLTSDNYPSIINDRHFTRLASYVEGEKIAFGGRHDREKRRIEPTILTDITWESSVMQDEIFGPILPILPYEDLEEVIKVITDRPKPLALYLFTREHAVQQQITDRISFGGGCINDTLMHLATPYLPFGGVGESGIGSYHGQFSFSTFSHEKSLLVQSSWLDIPFRYPGARHALKWLKRFMN
ncbi:aldehyde dehydrogenase [Paenibacillus sp. SC116]|uniref:aldehyde dehydrogenase n=1 Tax=Paenibacillus sp. SC116 TaxID=2968986 RepID=UPI00215ADC91|nr:aldehyde dehydrogenase [Paenibacillus sp. SC116]MCR8846124.1 aldehyde dehydrogenase [Paenibacillus sp. SC116]